MIQKLPTNATQAAFHEQLLEELIKRHDDDIDIISMQQILPKFRPMNSQLPPELEDDDEEDNRYDFDNLDIIAMRQSYRYDIPKQPNFPIEWQ